MTANADVQPPWSPNHVNDPALPGLDFTVPGIDNLPDIHGDPTNAKLVLFVGGNQFMVMPKLIEAFTADRPDLAHAIFYETLPPGILAQQMQKNGRITFGNLTYSVQPDVYEAGKRRMQQMEREGAVAANSTVCYVKNDLTIMISEDNPKGIRSLVDLGQPGVRVSMPNPQWEGIARQIIAAYRKAGGDDLVSAIMQTKKDKGETLLTHIHHRQTPLYLMTGQADAGVTWRSEAQFQERIGNPIAHVEIPAEHNSTAVYGAGLVKDTAHADAARAWLAFMQSEQAKRIYQDYGFQPLADCQGG